MLTVSLHGIKIAAPHGLYPEEQVLGNKFEVDVDVLLATITDSPLPFVDYTLINSIVAGVFLRPELLLEKFVHQIHTELKQHVPDAIKIKVTVRKLHPPMAGDISYAQVYYEA
ncbi:MAG: dihydroneopterin aldolase [Sphingobacteriales bacterium]|nr:MAG: dihydroneopterin aldolase [Sphingobacteriales bacterium]